ncbi:FtsX-like permease family protein [Bacteroidota bacterium]
MWRNFIKVAIRNLSRNKAFNFINISGLAIGLASSIFIILYIVNEVNYDRFHEKGKNMYRLYIDGRIAGEELKGAWTSPAFGPTFHGEIPEILTFCRFDASGNNLIWQDPTAKHLEDAVLFADSSFFDVFSIQLVEGDPATCLDEPHSILLTEESARKYFPDGNAMGEAIYRNTAEDVYTVTGIVKSAPRNSHFFYDFIISYCTLESSRNPGFLNNNMFTYYVLDEQADPVVVEEKINESLLNHIRPVLEQFMGITVEEFEASGDRYGLKMQHLYDIHLTSGIDLPRDNIYRPIGNRSYLYIFGVIAFFILVVASINFMNLSTARSISRAKEVSLRKVVGSSRRELVRQFLSESIVMSMFSMIVALVLVILLLPQFNSITALELNLSDLFKWYMFPAFILLTVFLGYFSGLYPASVLASYKPIHALKGKASTSNGTGRLRSALVILQFTISVVIVVGTLVIFWQFRYMMNKDIGFNQENMIIMDRVWPLGHDKLETFKAELLKDNSIEAVSNSTAFLGSPNNNNGYKIKEKDDTETFLFNTYWIDYDFVDTYELRFANQESRSLSREFGSDSSACLINEAAVRKFMIEDPLNTHVQWPQDDEGGFLDLRVVGVIEDVHYSSVKNDIAPMVLFLKRNDWGWVGYLNIRIKPGKDNAKLALAHMEKTWEEFTEDEPFQYIFLEEFYRNFYAEERRTGIITLIFSILSIFIASLGLLGMTLYNAQKRTREIGIRKVMGATERNILTMMAKGVLVSVALSVLVAWPISWYMTRDWLNGFPYNIGFQPLLFVFAAMLALIIALVTVSLTALKSARTDPAMALHYE